MTSVLGVVSVGCAVTSFGLLVNWASHRRDSLGRERDLPVLSVTALVLIAVVAAVPGARRQVEERRLARVASVLAGKHVSVHCQDGAAAFVDAGSELGYVAFDQNGVPEPKTLIKREQCQLLNSYLKHRGDPSYDEVVAVHVLTHESMHMRGETTESTAECQAVQRDVVTAHELGATPEQALALAHEYWTQVYPRMPDGYFTRSCGPGEDLDEKLDTAPWY